jgi:hypothetical protein
MGAGQAGIGAGHLPSLGRLYKTLLLAENVNERKPVQDLHRLRYRRQIPSA